MSTEDVMMSPPIEELMDRTQSKFALVTLSARRAREINSYFNQLGEGLGTMVPPQVSSVSRKPLSISFEEIAADKIKSVEMKVYDEFAAEADAALLDEAAEELQAGLEGGDDAVAAEVDPAVEVPTDNAE
ncbi:MAG: DNA-directed RNA polymerase subunit omega [Ilumatobacteraceae bacterium]